MIGCQVGISEGHLDVLVAQDRLQGLEASATHHEPTGEAMAQVVEMQAVELGLGDRVLEGRPDVAGRSYAAGVIALEARQDLVDGLAHREPRAADPTSCGRLSDYWRGEVLRLARTGESSRLRNSICVILTGRERREPPVDRS